MGDYASHSYASHSLRCLLIPLKLLFISSFLEDWTSNSRLIKELDLFLEMNGTPTVKSKCRHTDVRTQRRVFAHTHARVLSCYSRNTEVRKSISYILSVILALIADLGFHWKRQALYSGSVNCWPNSNLCFLERRKAHTHTQIETLRKLSYAVVFRYISIYPVSCGAFFWGTLCMYDL